MDRVKKLSLAVYAVIFILVLGGGEELYTIMR